MHSIMNYFQVSVIIPAYNVERYIEKAIRSALAQKEVQEVLVINDGSTDATVKKVLKIKDTRIKLLAHPANKNRGRSASRNLGIEKSNFEFIAFLDADDYYLPNRFEKDTDLFLKNPQCDAIHNAVGYDVVNPDYNYLKDQLYTVTREVEPKELFMGLLDGLFGHFQINGFTIKKQVLKSTGLFNEQLKVAEDTDFFWKVAIASNVYTGVIDQPVAMRVVHDENCFYRKDLYERYDYMTYESVIKWAAQYGVTITVLDRILRRIWIIKHKEKTSLWKETKYWMHLTTLHKRILCSTLTLKYFPLVRRRKLIFPVFYKAN